MEFNELKQILAGEAKAKGICNEWYEKILSAPSKEYLLTLAVKGSDFWLGNAFASPEVRAEFAGLRQHFGIYLDDDHIAAKSPRNLIALDRAHGSAKYHNFDVGQITAKDDTRINITADANAFVCVDVRDRAEVEITASGDARVSVILHGGECKHRATDRATIKITDKRD